MPIYKKSELLPFLQNLGASPKKGLSQNFLIDQNILNNIISTSGVKQNETVLEIGPGPGALTEALLQKGAHVIAVEKDKTLAHALERFSDVEVFCEDILAFDLKNLPEGKSKIIANLPYHLTTPILAKMLPRRDLFHSLTVMVQEEIAQRIVAQAKDPNYSSLSIFIRFHADPIYAFKVSRRCFYPVPAVDSAVVHLKLKEPPFVTNEKEFFTMCRTAFGQRRKMLRSSLSSLWPKNQILQALGDNETARPEELSLEELITLYETLKPLPKTP